MPPVEGKKGTIGILTGGGDCPGLNPAIRAVTIRALREGYQVLGLRNGWKGLVSMVRTQKPAADEWCQVLTAEVVNMFGRMGGTFLHTSRTLPTKIPLKSVPEHLRRKYQDPVNDLTPEVLQNLEFLGIDYLVPIGGDDTLSYAAHLMKQGVKVIAIPKTMDNDVPGTDYCIGFSTCVTRTIEMTHSLRTTASSHERILVVEVFGRYAGFTALLPTMAGVADRCVIPEHPFNIERLTELLVADRAANPDKYSVVLVSEGAIIEGRDMVFAKEEKDMYGHKKLGGIGDIIAGQIKELSAQFNKGEKIDTTVQNLSYMVRSGDPDTLDSIVPMAYGNMVLDLLGSRIYGRLVAVRNGRYDNVPLETVISKKKIVDVEKHYNREQLRPIYGNFESKPLLIMTSDY
ncbi:MAG: ATP-dependent 6-phosphofructokinase [Deltaproteobacteria bacterium]|nr:ATP-dependent 6-phosphofructokinase [Deltaproteobacteria bacterium]